MVKKPKKAQPKAVAVPIAEEPQITESEEKIMADNNYDPLKVGGLQPIYCPQCGEEVKALDSYQLSTDNKRYHYPECWQRHELEKAG